MTVHDINRGCPRHGRQPAEIVGTIGADNHGMICRVCKAKERAVDIATDGACGLSWDDSISTAWTPAPAARCPFEYFHQYDDNDEPIELEPDDVPAGFAVKVVAR